MLLMIDNYDSFTYNLVQYFGELKQEVVVFRNDQISLDEVEALAPAQIVISPGPCTPNEAGICLDLIKKASGKVPIMGVCLGHQAIGQAFGGNVVRAPSPVHGKLSEVPMDDKRRLFDVNFWGVVNGCRTAVRHFRTHGGTIINIGSVVSDRAIPLQGMYSASKRSGSRTPRRTICGPAWSGSRAAIAAGSS